MAVMRTDETSAESPGWETIEELFTVLEAPLLGYALRYTGDLGLAEDVVQEAFMKLHAQFDSVDKPRPWLYRTVHNLALNQRRTANKTTSLDQTPANESSPLADARDPGLLPDEQIIRLEGIGLVRISLAALDDRSRELIRLKFTENLSYKDIAEKMGLTPTNVGYILHHALKTIAEELAGTGVVP
jgi:RNA polymerase sigma factor (sigma-70 family)